MSTEDISAELSEGADATQDNDTEENLDLDDTDDVPSTWDDKGDPDTDDSDTDDTAQETAQVIRVKAGGQVHEINMADTERVQQLLSLGLGARPAFAERDKLRKAVSGKDKEIEALKKYKGLWDKLEASKGNREALYEKIFGEKFETAAKAWKDQQDQYESASPEERRLLDLQRKTEAQAREFEERAKTWEERQRDADTKVEQASLKELRAQMLPEFYKYEFSEKVKDQATAAKLNKALWKLAIAELKEQGDVEDLPAEVVRKAFRDTHDMLWSNAQTSAKQEVKRIVTKKKETAKKQAQVASTRNYTGDPSKLAQEKDPVKLFRKMFGR